MFVAKGAFNAMLLPKLKTVDGVTSRVYVNSDDAEDAAGGTGL